MAACRKCVYWNLHTRECSQEDFVRENLKSVSGWGEMELEIMMENGVDTFGTPPDYRCEYYEEES